MKIEWTTNPETFENRANFYPDEKASFAAIHTCVDPCVWAGLYDEVFDASECAKRNLFVGRGPYYAGAIVNMPGDITVCITTWGPCDMGELICCELMSLMTKRGIDAKLDGNDVLAKEEKVVSYVSVAQANGWTKTFVHVSIGKMDLELVKAICTKPMIKVPGSLSDLGISTEDILNVIGAIISKRSTL